MCRAIFVTTWSKAAAALAVVWFALATSAAANAALWTVVDLHPAGAGQSKALGIRGNQQVGTVDSQAAMWTGTAASFVNFGSGNVYGQINGTDGVEQAGGFGSFTGNQFTGTANIWTGTPGSLVAIPADPGFTAAFATGVFAGLQSGFQDFYAPGNFAPQHREAGMWVDAPGTWINLHPAGAQNSQANGIYNGQEVGTAYFPAGLGQIGRAGIWANSAASYTDLTPVGFSSSEGLGVYNGKQVGSATPSGGPAMPLAMLWSNTAASYVNLNPAGAQSSAATAIYNNDEAGYATFAGATHAGVWSGTAASWDDLHGYLPGNYVSSQAAGIWTSPLGTTFVVGWATDGDTNLVHAKMWVETAVPEPGTTVLAVLGAGCLLRMRASRMRAK